MAQQSNTSGSAAGFWQQIWTFFASVRLSVVLLLLLAVTSVVGTLIPQHPGHSHGGDSVFAKIEGILQLHDMYHSWWFRFLLLLLAINLVVCTLERLPGVWKIVRRKPGRIHPARVEALPHQRTFVFGADMETARKKAIHAVGKMAGSAQMQEMAEGFIVHGESGRWSRLGVYVVHTSILLLLAGGMIGSLFGFSGAINIPEGQMADEIRLRESRAMMPLGFAIRCDDFEVQFYDDGSPKEFRSRLTILENDEPVVTRDIRVNHPLSYKGVRIFQASYGTADAKNVTLRLVPEEGEAVTVSTRLQEPVAIPFNGGSVTLMQFMDNFRVRGHVLGPTFVGFYEAADGKRETFAIPLRHPGFDRMRKRGFHMEVPSFERTYFTGLQVNRDPGVGLVYAGFCLLLMGCYVAFFLSHRSYFVCAMQKEGEIVMRVAATANRNKSAMAERVRRMADLVQPPSETRQG